MSRLRRKLTPFSLSFLDIMSCGFGAVVLLFLIIKHNVDSNIISPVSATGLESEVSLLEEEILDGQAGLARIRNTISEFNDKLAEAQGLAARISEKKKELEGLTNELSLDNVEGRVEELKTEIQKLETRNQQLEKEVEQSGGNVRKFAGDGDRAYITGLKLGGERMLILLDVSASMLDKSITNVLRRRNMRDERQRQAPKWTKVVEIVDWLTAKFPLDGRFQIYAFNTTVNPVLDGTKGQWLESNDKIKLDNVVKQLRQIVPEDGTNLENAFIAAANLSPPPDNIYLITDGLPTQGASGARGTTISGRDRLKLFEKAIKKLPKRVPVNVILAPLEGDPDAARAFWRLAEDTDGSFMSPSADWP